MDREDLAREVALHLGSGGFNSLKRAHVRHEEERDRAISIVQDLEPVDFIGLEDPLLAKAPKETHTLSGYTMSKKDGVTIAYQGHASREDDFHGGYRLVLENCGFIVTEENDPERPGRQRLRVEFP